MQPHGAGGRGTGRHLRSSAVSGDGTIKRESGWGTFFSCLVLLILAGVAFYLFFYPVILNVQRARSWQAVTCQILESRIVTHEARSRGTTRTGTTYSIEILYKYEFDGDSFTSYRYSFMNGGSDSTIKGKRAIVSKYKAGTTTNCFVDPDNPSSAVLFRGYPKMMWFILIPLLLAAIGVRGLIKAGRGILSPRR